MIARLTRIVLIGVLLAAYIQARPAVCEAWSLLHPFTSDDQAAANAKKPTYIGAKTQPSTWDKATGSTKSFFSKTGEAIGLKKPDAKKPTPSYAYVKPPVLQNKKAESTSWLGSWFKPKEPDKPKTVGEWMNSTTRVDPK
jgi:hypothetical protein